MKGDDMKFDDLQSFLQHHKKAASSRGPALEKTLRKVISNQNISKMADSDLSLSLSKLNEQTPRGSHISAHSTTLPKSTLYHNDSNLSTTFSPEISSTIDSGRDDDHGQFGKMVLRTSHPQLDLALITSKEDHRSLRSSYFKTSALVLSPSNKTDSGVFHDNSMLSESDSSDSFLRSEPRHYQSKSRYFQGRVLDRNREELNTSHDQEDEAKEKRSDFVMVQQIYPHADLDTDTSPSNSRIKKSGITLDEDIFPKNVIAYANKLDPTSFSNYIKELVSYFSRSHLINSEFFSSRPKSEALFSILFKDKEREIFEKLLSDLCYKLKEESVSFKHKYRGEIDFFEAKLAQIMSRNKVSGKVEEKDIRAMFIKITPLLGEPNLLVSRSVLEFTSNYLEILMSKFTAPLKIQPTKASATAVIEYITLPKFLEKVLFKSEHTTFFRDVLIYTYDLYITPINLMLYFCFKYFVPEPLGMSRSELKSFQTSHILKIKTSVLSILIVWLQERSLDFIKTPSLLTILSNFLEVAQRQEKISALNETINLLLALHKKITHRLIDIQPDESEANDSFEQSDPASARDSKARLRIRRTATNQDKTLGFMSFSLDKNVIPNYDIGAFLEETPEAISEQLTLLNWKQFSRIQVGEIINKRWTKGDKKECPNYWKHVSHFNAFSSWIQYTILSQESFIRRKEISDKFLDIAMICVEKYRNYSSSYCIFSALLALRRFGVISFELEQNKALEKLGSLFAPTGSYIKLYNQICRDVNPPTVPNLNIFLQIFLKLQEGVTFTTNLPESPLKFLKFQLMVQIHDYCKQMIRLQKVQYSIQKNHNLYTFLKNGFKGTAPMNLENEEEVNAKISEMVQPLINTQSKLKKFFGLQTN